MRGSTSASGSSGSGHAGAPTLQPSGTSGDQGMNRAACSGVTAWGSPSAASSESTHPSHSSGLRPFALAVVTREYTHADASAPVRVSHRSQLRLPTQNGRMAFSARLLSRGTLGSATHPRSLGSWPSA